MIRNRSDLIYATHFGSNGPKLHVPLWPDPFAKESSEKSETNQTSTPTQRLLNFGPKIFLFNPKLITNKADNHNSFEFINLILKLSL